MNRKVLFAALALQLAAGIAVASWYDDYDAGVRAVRAGQWQVVVQKMSAAIKDNPKEDNHARTYGAIFINYHPYYYRGVAYLNLGKYDLAISDFEKTAGPGEVDQGPLETLMERAKTKLAEATAPQPVVPQPQPVRPVPQPVVPQPVGPTIDPALRQQAQSKIAEARQHLADAQKRRATQSPEYMKAADAIVDANSRAASAKTNDDLRNAIAIAENAATYADAAVAPGLPTPQPLTRPTVATNAVIGDLAQRVHRALESYFNGEFDDAASQFASLSREMPRNGWIWAFLGASQYSQYAFEADDTYKEAAMKSFREAKRLRSWGTDGLPQKYFSKRIRKVFLDAS